MKMKKRIAALLLAVVLVVSLTGCKDTLTGVAHKLMGTSDEVQEEDTTRWAEQTGDPLIIQGIADASAKFATATADGCLYAVFNGIWSRQTSYFVEKGGRRRRVCAGEHLLCQDRRHRLPLHRLRAGPGGAVSGDHLL